MNPENAQCAPWGHYDDVDHQGHPEGAVRHLDYITGVESVKAYKRETYALLGIQPGSMVLDAGCGTGDDVLAMAQLLQGRGRIVGLDSSATMLETARARAAGTDLPVEFRLGDVYALDSADGVFDGCRADRLFHHLGEPDRALGELIRVTKPGGRIVLFDPDFDASVIATANKAVARQVIHAICDRVHAGAESRNHFARMRRAGLTDIIVIPKTFLFLDYALGEQLLGIEDAVQRLLDQAAINQATAELWLGELKQRDSDTAYLSMILGFTVAGRKLANPY
jgi:ubiquinone/menaquinone biosynthesis C-methylase UbiE